MTKYCTDSSDDSSYGTVDNKTTLEPEDDAATQIMGDEWRMPTQTEWQELLNNTTNEWTQVNGVNGRKFTSTTDTSKYIFIPAAGIRSDSSFSGQGSYSGVWSSSLETSLPYTAWVLFFGFDEIYADNDEDRYKGQPVRGVFK